MALPLSWNGNGLAAGTLTLSSAGTGDTAFSELGSGTITISSSGPTPPRIAFPATTANTYVAWEQAAVGTISQYVVVVYFELAALGTASHALVKGASAANAESWRVDVAGTGSSPPGVLRLRNGSAQIAAGTTSLATSTVYRLEVTADGTATTAAVYVGDSTTAHTTLSGTASLSSISEVWFGNPTGSTTNPQIFMDGFSVANPAPATVQGTVAGSAASGASASATAVLRPAASGSAASGAGATARAVLRVVAAGSAASGASASAGPGTVSGGTVTGAASSTASATGAVPAAETAPPPILAPEPGPLTQARSVPYAGPVPVVRPPGWFVVIRGGDGQRLGAINPTNVRMTLRYNDVSDWSLNVPLDRTNAALLRTPGAGVLVYRGDAMDMDPILSGPIGSRTINMTEDGAHITVAGPDDLVWVSGRIAFQNPARTGANQNTPLSGALTHDRRSGPAETVIKGYVNANAGPAALSARQRLVIETDAGRGADVAGSARMTPLLDLIGPLAATGGVGFKVVQNTLGQLEFRVFIPEDRTASARFSPMLRNVTDWSVLEKAPTSTYAVVGGQGQMLNRVFVDQEDASAYTPWPNWRMETFQNRTDTNLTAELDQTLAETLLEGGPAVSLSIQTRDTSRLRFGRDYRMGDRVTVEVLPGYVVQDVIREVEVDWTADEGETIVTRVGSKETTGTSAIQRLARKLKVKSQAVETVE